MALLATVACNAILGNESSYRLAPKSSCLLNSDCTDGQICVFATCSKPCHEDKDCEPGARCLATSSNDGTACVMPAQASCTDDSCPDGTMCSAGSCRTLCSTREPCRADQSCSNGACIGTDSAHDPAASSLGGAGGSSSGSAGHSGSGNASGADTESSGGEAGEAEAGGNSVGGGSSRAGAGGSIGSSGGTGGLLSSAGRGGAAGGTGGALSSGGNGGSGGGCPEGTYRCISSPATTSQLCSSGMWSNSQVCTGATAACSSGKCSVCADGAKDCSSNTPRTCVNGAWQVGIACGASKTCATGVCSCAVDSCGDVCTTKLTDANNCGTCGHSCQNGTCTSGKCDPVTLSSALTKPWSIATDGTTLSYGTPSANVRGVAADGDGVYWLEANVVKQHNTSSLNSGTPGILSSGIPSSEGIAAYGSFVYFASTNGTIYRVPNVPGTAAVPLVSGQIAPSGIAADASGVYWTDRNPNQSGKGAVMRAPLTGGTATPLVSGLDDPRGIALDGTTVYWTNTDAGKVMKVAK